MTIMMLAYALAVPSVSGFLFVTWCTRSDLKQSFFERFFLGFGIGTGIITFEMFLLGLFRIPLNTGGDLYHADRNSDSSWVSPVPVRNTMATDLQPSGRRY